MFNTADSPHRRWNPLLREWVLVSPQRTQRPWQGEVEPITEPAPAYDPGCYLCPGNSRAGGRRNPKYEGAFVFDNDFPALLPDIPLQEFNHRGLMVVETERGICRVVCFSPRHDLTLADMPEADLRRVVEVWRDQYTELGGMDWVRHVQIFENRGAIMGASNPHPHCQIWANASVPNIPAAEHQSLAEFRKVHQQCMLCEYLALEISSGERVIAANTDFAAVVPFWAVWPFEVLLLSNAHLTGMDQLDSGAQQALAEILKSVTTRYNNLFQTSFPYSMGFHQRPTDGDPHPEWHFHAHFLPPLLRSATIRKFMVGYELLSSPQRDITPETAATMLRAAQRSRKEGI